MAYRNSSSTTYVPSAWWAVVIEGISQSINARIRSINVPGITVNYTKHTFGGDYQTIEITGADRSGSISIQFVEGSEGGVLKELHTWLKKVIPGNGVFTPWKQNAKLITLVHRSKAMSKSNVPYGLSSAALSPSSLPSDVRPEVQHIELKNAVITGITIPAKSYGEGLLTVIANFWVQEIDPYPKKSTKKVPAGLTKR